MLPLDTQSLYNMLPTPTAMASSISAICDKVNALKVDWMPPTAYSSLSPMEFYACAMGSLVMFFTMHSHSRKLTKAEYGSLKSLIVVIGLCLAAFRVLVEGVGFIIVNLMSTEPGKMMKLCVNIFDAFADLLNSWTMAIAQIVSLKMITSCMGLGEVWGSLTTPKLKLIGFTICAATLLSELPLGLLLIGNDGDPSEGTLHLGLGRRLATGCQVVAQLLILVVLSLARRNPDMRFGGPKAKPHSTKLRKIYLDHSFRILLFVSYCLLVLLARSFPDEGFLSNWFQNPLMLHWIEFFILALFSSIVSEQAKLEEEEAMDEALILIADEEMQIETPAQSTEAEAQTDEQKVEQLVSTD